MAEALALFRFLHFAALMAAFGAAAFACYAAAPAPAGTVRHAALVALASGLAMLPVTAARMAGENAAAFDPQILRAVLFDTGFGHVWCLHLALLIPPRSSRAGRSPRCSPPQRWPASAGSATPPGTGSRSTRRCTCLPTEPGSASCGRCRGS